MSKLYNDKNKSQTPTQLILGWLCNRKGIC